jgi:hypothetical protein
MTRSPRNRSTRHYRELSLKKCPLPKMATTRRGPRCLGCCSSSLRCPILINQRNDNPARRSIEQSRGLIAAAANTRPPEPMCN